MFGLSHVVEERYKPMHSAWVRVDVCSSSLFVIVIVGTRAANDEGSQLAVWSGCSLVGAIYIHYPDGQICRVSRPSRPKRNTIGSQERQRYPKHWPGSAGSLLCAVSFILQQSSLVLLQAGKWYPGDSFVGLP